MATHSSVLSWIIPRPEEPGGLQSMGLQRLGHDRVANTLAFRLYFMAQVYFSLQSGGSKPTELVTLNEDVSG